MGCALVTKLLDRKVETIRIDHIRIPKNRKWYFLFLNNQIRFSNISVSTIQTVDDLNYLVKAIFLLASSGSVALIKISAFSQA